MGAKVSFNELTKIITVTLPPDVNGEVFIDVKADLYSDGKEDWVANENLRRFAFPVVSVGGNPLPGEKALGATFFLASDWKIRPYEANHRLIINGNLYSADGTDPFLDTIGTYTVRIMQQVSSLVDSTIQQLPEIEYASFSGGVTIDITSIHTGTGYPVGTPQEPVNNIDDAYAIAVNRGFINFYVQGNLHLTDSVPELDGFTFIGEGMDRTELEIDNDAVVTDCAYRDATVSGTLDGNSRLISCQIENLVYVKGFVEQCVLAPGTIILAGSEEAHFLDCWSGVPGTSTPTINMGGSGQALALRNYNGGIRLINKNGTDPVSIDLNSGQIILESSITDGDIVCRGIGKLTDNSVGANVLADDLLNAQHIENHIWNSQLANHTIPGSTGNELATKADVLTGEGISDAVWSSNSGLQVLTDLSFIAGIEGGRWTISGNQMIFYLDDNITEIARFDLTYDGNLNPIERTRI